MPRTLSIMTFNAGLTGWNLFGTQIDVVPNSIQRYNDVVDFLKSVDADVVCLQEIFGDYRAKLIRDLVDTFPYIYAHTNELTGLCVLSKILADDVDHLTYDVQLGIDFAFKKGFTYLRINEFHISTTHETVGGVVFGNMSSTTIKTRNRHAAQLISYNRLVETNHRDARDTNVYVTCGDFNSAPEQMYDNYIKLCEHGYDVGRPSAPATWDKNNPLISDSITSNVFFAEDVSHRCDLIFARGNHRGEQFTPNITEYNTHCRNELSDHYAVSCVISHPY